MYLNNTEGVHIYLVTHLEEEMSDLKKQKLMIGKYPATNDRGGKVV